MSEPTTTGSDLVSEAKPKDKLRLGGMALANGLLIHGPTHWAVAVRTESGEIKAASGRKPRVKALDQVPGVRGVVRLGESMVVIPLVKRGLPEVRLPFQRLSVVAVGAAASIVGTRLRRHRPGVVGESASALVSIAPALFTLRGGELAQYHGVEHKAIAAYEQGIEDTSAPDKEHERCGSHLIAPMLATNVAGTLLVRRLVERPGPKATVAISLVSMGLSVELFSWCERHPDSAITRAIRAPGFAIQRLIGTREPDAAQLEVGRAALDEILRVEGVA